MGNMEEIKLRYSEQVRQVQLDSQEERRQSPGRVILEVIIQKCIKTDERNTEMRKVRLHPDVEKRGKSAHTRGPGGQAPGLMM